jgi:hypothetical protein
VEPSWEKGLQLAGPITAKELDVAPVDPPPDRSRHKYGNGPFARLRMPPLPNEAGLYVWTLDGLPVYVGQTRGTLRSRLGSNGYATISTYNTFARQSGRTNGGQQTNCRVNALANAALAAGHDLALWYRTTDPSLALAAEAAFITSFGKPTWNR